MDNFHTLEVVGRGIESQLEMGGNWNYLIWRLKGLTNAYLMLVRRCITINQQ